MDLESIVRELRTFAVFSGLEEDDMLWFAAKLVPLELEPGQILVRAGDPAVYMCIILEGEVQAEGGGAPSEQRFFMARGGDITGMLPYSRLTKFPLSSRATKHTRILLLHKDEFPPVLERMPVLAQRLVGIMADRIREVTKIDVQRDKMMALGRLAAGMAHELNNPASAAGRAAAAIREAVRSAREANARLDRYSFTPEQRAVLNCVEQEISDRPSGDTLDTLERSDREDTISAWLQRHRVPNAWSVAPALVESGFDEACLDEVAQHLPDEVLGDAFTRITAAVTISRLSEEIESATCRIVELIKSIKDYTYMDQMPAIEMDVHQGIESTLTMLRHRIRSGITVKRNFAENLPKVCARGNELNQVWTNLIDNAVDAMDGKGELRIRTALELKVVVVEIRDSGRGISPEIQNRIFEPFFTTKPPGEGTGLGLDIAYRIVRAHSGDIRVTSVQGDTRFQVRLPAAV